LLRSLYCERFRRQGEKKGEKEKRRIGETDKRKARGTRLKAIGREK
jgi:hypothetical protein